MLVQETVRFSQTFSDAVRRITTWIRKLRTACCESAARILKYVEIC